MGFGNTDWFIHDRFGLFIHWGLYSLPARHEWVKSRERLTDEDYAPYFRYFEPDLYDPKQWAKEAREAGFRYAILTSKHHEGFALWDSALTDYKATNTPIGRDLLGEWVDAFRAEGLKIGFYHSVIDWHHPSYTVDPVHPQRDDEEFRKESKTRDMAIYREYLHGQVRELLTNYGKIDIMWYDFSFPDWEDGKGRADWDSEALVAMTHELQPGIIINDRLDYPESADFVTPEQYQPDTAPTRGGERVAWEACQTLNGTWGYDRDNQDWKSPRMLIQMLVDTVAKGGNLLLNVGPTGRGEFEPRARETLGEIGTWMRQHERSIVGAGASEFTAPPDTRLTQRGDRVYVHVFNWPMRHIHLQGLRGRVAYAQLLHDASEVKRIEIDPDEIPWNTHMPGEAGTVILELPIVQPDVTVPVIEVFLKPE